MTLTHMTDENYHNQSREYAVHSSISRPQLHRSLFEHALLYVNRVAGGEPRKIRRAMARARSKRKAII